MPGKETNEAETGKKRAGGGGREKNMPVEEVKKAAIRKKRKHAYVYGNYKFYYGYRIGRNSKEDPRLAVLKKEWFEGKDCLDIGCNQGLITIDIAKKFYCRRILGIDIDPVLIGSAYSRLRNIARSEQANVKLVMASESQISNGEHAREHTLSQCLVHAKVDVLVESSPEEVDLLKRVSFQAENFVENLPECSEKRGCSEKYECSEQYDTIICLSVTKWIHLNWGDEGLITLFLKIWRLLRPGGILLLEPQPWHSYRKNRLVSETANLNFQSIMFSPDLFQEILLDKIGFRSVENITDSLSGAVTGFDRPIFAFHK